MLVTVLRLRDVEELLPGRLMTPSCLTGYQGLPHSPVGENRSNPTAKAFLWRS